MPARIRQRERRLLAAISRPVEEVFASVEQLRRSMLAITERVDAAERPLHRRDLVALRPAITEVLSRHAGFCAGAGVVLAPDVMTDTPLWIEWWWLDHDGALDQLHVDLDPDSAEFYDYTMTEWFREPARTGERHIAGPYVDYICTHEYTFTLSAPLVHDGRFIGVAGADILASAVEQLVVPGLARLPRVTALASGNGRVISSNSTQLMPGMILNRQRAAYALRPVAGPDRPRTSTLPWVLLEGEPRETAQVRPRRSGARQTSDTVARAPTA
jgi:hypothetical protein